MKRLVVGECEPQNIYNIVDPTSFLEIAFEAEVVRAFACLEPDYLCGVFAGVFVFEDQRCRADLALIHRSLSHWFVVEVELLSHSLRHHVLPQVRCFRYGDPSGSCVSSLMGAFSFASEDDAARFLRHTPRFVAVVGNLPDLNWQASLEAIDAQYLVLSVYRNSFGHSAHEISGRLVARKESLGFARYSAIDNCLRINRTCGLRAGPASIIDQFGSLATWIIREQSGVLWISKETGPTLINHDTYVQILRAIDGSVSLRISP